MSCNNCGGDILDSLYTAPAFDSPSTGFQLARCPGCHLVSTLEVSQECLSDSYSSGYYGSPGRKFSPVIELLISFLHKSQAKKLRKIWLRRKPMGAQLSVMDIGCGRGLLLGAFQSLGAQIRGLERDTYAVSPPLEEFVKVGSISDIDYAGSQFDIIVLWHVLEHLHEPEALVRKLYEHLREDALLVIAVPNYDSVQRVLFDRHWFHLDVPRHLVHFEAPWLLEKLRNQGLNIETVQHFDLTQNIYGFIQSALNRIFPGRANELYGLLKGDVKPDFLKLGPWILAAAVLLPFAVLESLYGVMVKKGATVAIIARRGKND